ncbi:hypothetical protein MUO93_11945 [Candidatus Bathyarchaeota archaeon]|nr:hypothetical protein [Candidatus Bathyarchaeota archaeon]
MNVALDVLIRYLRQADGKIISVVRPGSRRNRLDLKINDFDEGSERISISFIGGRSVGLPLYIWMFERVIERLSKEKGFVPVGARLAPPYMPGSLEAAIWVGKGSPYKAAPHVCDILLAAGLVEYGEARNRETNRIVQAARLLSASERGAPEEREKEPRIIDERTQERGDGKDIVKEPEGFEKCSSMTPTHVVDYVGGRDRFLEENGSIIRQWTDENRERIVRARESYSWGRKSTKRCVSERNALFEAIRGSRLLNSGGLDLKTLDMVTRWGFNRRFPMRDEEEAVKVTQKAFSKLDGGDLEGATLEMMSVRGVGISRASKIIGLSDQENLCIFDSRVGKALRGLVCRGDRVVLCPPGYDRGGDALSKAGWARQYLRCIWVVQAIRDRLRELGVKYSAADVEMALFMLGN